MKPHNQDIPEGLTTPIGEVYRVYTLDTPIDKECPYCLETFQAGSEVIRTDCFCLYHYSDSCAIPWFEKEKRCPVHGSDLETPGK